MVKLDGLGGVPYKVCHIGLVDDVNVPLPNGVDDMYRQYRVTITPHAKKGDPD